MMSAVSDMSQEKVVASSDESLKASAAKPRILIAASSSGGHLIPAVHIAQAVQACAPGAVVEFIGVGKPLEDTLVVKKGFVRHIVSASGVKNRGPIGLLTALIRMPFSFLTLRRLYRRFQPTAVVGVGGYVSVLPVITARMLGIPTWAHEAEKHPGLANRVLAYFSEHFSVAFEGTMLRGWSKVTVTGHPVRPELKKIDREAIPREVPRRLLVIGGSQGARGLDTVVPTLGALFNERGIEVVHQSRPESVGEVTEAYKKVGVTAHVVPFIEDMLGAYEWCDVVISRAGASSVAELACVNRPTIFVPYPHQQGTHQTDNARILVKHEKAYLVEETDPDFPQRLKEALVELLTPTNFLRMKRAAYEPKGLGAAEAIAKGIISLSPKA